MILAEGVDIPFQLVLEISAGLYVVLVQGENELVDCIDGLRHVRLSVVEIFHHSSEAWWCLL